MNDKRVRKASGVERWANVVVRAAHQIAVVGLGAAVLGAPVTIVTFAGMVLTSGVVLFALELAGNPQMFAEAAGLAVLVKLAMVLWMALDSDAPAWLFWFIVGWSTMFAHAPSAFRHTRLFRSRICS